MTLHSFVGGCQHFTARFLCNITILESAQYHIPEDHNVIFTVI